MSSKFKSDTPSSATPKGIKTIGKQRRISDRYNVGTASKSKVPPTIYDRWMSDGVGSASKVPPAQPGIYDRWMSDYVGTASKARLKKSKKRKARKFSAHVRPKVKKTKRAKKRTSRKKRTGLFGF